MKHTEQEITDIAKQIKARIEKEYNTKLNHTIEEAIYDTERQCWIVIAVSKLFEQENLFSYFISDDTGKLIKTIDKYGYNTYLPRPEITDKDFLHEWEYDLSERPNLSRDKDNSLVYDKEESVTDNLIT